LVQLLQVVERLHVPDRTGLGTHDHRVGGGAAPVEVDAAQVLAPRDSGGGEEDVVRGDQVGGGEHLVEFHSLPVGDLDLGFVSRPQPALDLTAHAGQGGRRQDRLRRPPDTQQTVDVGVVAGAGDRGGYVAVADQGDPGPRLSY